MSFSDTPLYAPLKTDYIASCNQTCNIADEQLRRGGMAMRDAHRKTATIKLMASQQVDGNRNDKGEQHGIDQ